MAASKIASATAKALPSAAPASPAPAKKAPAKVAAAKVAAPAKTEEKVRIAWNHGKTVVHHAVRVGKQTFTSTWQAFLGIPELAGLSRGQHIKFRKALKQAPGGKLDFKDPATGKVFPFQIIAE